MTSSRATTTVTIHGHSQFAFDADRQQANVDAAHQHLVHQRIEDAAQRARQILPAGEVAVKPVGEGGDDEDDQTPEPQLVGDESEQHQGQHEARGGELVGQVPDARPAAEESAVAIAVASLLQRTRMARAARS